MLNFDCVAGGMCRPCPNTTFYADRIVLCCVLVNVVRLQLVWVKHFPEISDGVPCHKPLERPHGTTITLTGASAIKEISNSQAFYADFGHSFEAIQVVSAALCHWSAEKRVLLRQLQTMVCSRAQFFSCCHCPLSHLE